MFAVNTGIWTATFAVLEATLVRIVHHCRLDTTSLNPDTQTL